MSSDVLSLFSSQLWSSNADEQLLAITALLAHLSENSADFQYGIERLSRSLASDWRSSRTAAATCLIHLANAKMQSSVALRQSLTEKFANSTKRELLLQDAFLLFVAISTFQPNDEGLTALIQQCAIVSASRAYLQDCTMHALIQLLEKIRVWNVDKQLKIALQQVHNVFFENPTWSIALVALVYHLQFTFSASVLLTMPPPS